MARATSQTSSKSQQKPTKGGRRRSRVFDFFLGYFGVCLAAISAYLPFHVYNNVADFGPPRMEFTGRSDFGVSQDGVTKEAVAEYIEKRRPLFREELRANLENSEIDTVVTGSINPSPAELPTIRESSEPRLRVTTPGGPAPNLVEHESMELVFASRGRALVRDGGDVLPVAIGSRLPDGSKVKSIKRLDNGWQLMTSRNSVLTLVN